MDGEERQHVEQDQPFELKALKLGLRSASDPFLKEIRLLEKVQKRGIPSFMLKNKSKISNKQSSYNGRLASTNPNSKAASPRNVEVEEANTP